MGKYEVKKLSQKKEVEMSKILFMALIFSISPLHVQRFPCMKNEVDDNEKTLQQTLILTWFFYLFELFEATLRCFFVLK